MYDYIIVGAGSAGCVLAARLSEDPGISVLLLEAGPPDDAAGIRMPAATPTLWQWPFAWEDWTVPQPGAGDRRVFWPHGRVVGGSSSINGMVYIRGNRLDYDSWRDDYGCAGWGYDDLLPYFRKAEDQQRGESCYHGAGGPLRVADPAYLGPLAQAWVSAAMAAGLPGNGDFNGAKQEGAGFYQVTQRKGRRWSAADAYLAPAAGRPNLTVVAGAQVTRVLVAGARAAGVRYLLHEAEREERAGREVILSGGAINSPQLLLLSGIGPASQLREHGIEVMVDAPRVGAGLQDHPACFLGWRTPGIPVLGEEMTPGNIALWERAGGGPMASHGIEAGGFARSRAGLPAPDLQFGIAAAPPPVPDQGPPAERAASAPVVAVRVRSRGSITLRSADPLARAVIDPAYLADEADTEVLVAGVRLVREIAAREPLASLLAGELAPGGGACDDGRLRAWVRRTAGSVFHPTSSCAMGGAPGAACDPELRVRGIDGLRVVDASVMPAAPRGNTNAPTIAIAERAADLILGNTPLQPVPTTQRQPVPLAGPR